VLNGTLFVKYLIIDKIVYLTVFLDGPMLTVSLNCPMLTVSLDCPMLAVSLDCPFLIRSNDYETVPMVWYFFIFFICL
jgi:hypothetical protein